MTGKKSPEQNGSQDAGQAAGSKAGGRGGESRIDKQTTPAADGSHTSVQASSPAELPVDSLRDAAPFLRRPFMPEAIRFKVQAQWGPKGKPPTGGLIVAYIDARLVVERLNAVCPHLWHDEYVAVDAKHLLCKLTVDGVTRQDVGEASGVSKDLYSDALKRAAVKFGVGVSVYALPQIQFNVGKNGLEVGSNGKLRIPESTLARLRDRYATGWLPGPGRLFGAPLDHGDTLEPLAGELAEDTEPEEEPTAQVAEGPEAEELRVAIKAAYDELRDLDSTVVTPAEYARRRREADSSVEGLADLAGFLLEKKAEAQKVVA